MTDKVLIDTSVWIDFFRAAKGKDKIEILLYENKAAYCGLIATELLRGAKGDEELNTLNDLFSTLCRIEESYETFYRAGVLGYSLARKGINLSTVDLAIAQICLDNEISIFTHDKHFNIIADHSALNVLS